MKQAGFRGNLTLALSMLAVLLGAALLAAALGAGRAPVLGALAIGGIAALTFAFTSLGALTRRLRRAAEQLATAGEGARPELDTGTEDDLGQVLIAAQAGLLRAAQRLEDSGKGTRETQRLRSALDNVSTNVMLADNDGNIVYMNRAVQAMLTTAESDIRKELPSFSAARLVGMNFDTFHKNPAHQRGMLRHLHASHTTTIKVGGRSFRLIASPVITDSGERLGTVVDWVDMTEQLRLEGVMEQQRQAERLLAEEATRAKITLDNVATNVMIADADNKIIYMNKSVMAMMTAAESDIRKDLPNFNTSRLIGSVIDVFHKNPSHQRQMLSSLSNMYRTSIKVGGRSFRLTANPIFNETGGRIGTSVEWLDATAELKIQDEIQAMVDAVVAGDLGRRIEIGGKEGFMRVLSEGINRLTEVSSGVIDQTVQVMEHVVQGDLTMTIHEEYQGVFRRMADATNATVGKLNEVVGDVRTAANAVSQASQQVSQTAQSLSQSTSEQAANVEETSASIEEMTASIAQNADNARTTDGMASKAAKETAEGAQAVRETLSAMKQIAGKIGIVDDIAYQTNMLALNAAIEAARAGEHGKGFAVVAAEVRKLAERSQVAAQEISELATGSVQVAENAGKRLDEIVPNIVKTSELVQSIAAASEEQAAGVKQVNTAMGQLNQVSQGNAASSEELAATSQELGQQADRLQEIMAFFQIADGSSGNRRPTAGATTAQKAPPAYNPGGGQGQSRAAVNPPPRSQQGQAQGGAQRDFVKF